MEEDLDDIGFLTDRLDGSFDPHTHPSERLTGTSQREIFQSFHPHPFILAGWMSARLVAGYIGQLIVSRTLSESVDDQRLMAGLQQSEKELRTYMPYVMQARRGLRHDIAIQIGSILDSSSAVEGLIDRLAPALYLLKVCESCDTGVQMLCTPFF